MGRKFSVYLSWSNFFDRKYGKYGKRDSSEFGLEKVKIQPPGTRLLIIDKHLISGELHEVRGEVRSEVILTLPYRMKKRSSFDCFRIGDFIVVRDESTQKIKFRGIVHQIRRNRTGNSRTVIVRAKNAGGYLLEDQSIYYLNQQILKKDKDSGAYITPEQAEKIKTKLGWLARVDRKNLRSNSNAGEFMSAISEFVNLRVQKIRGFFENGAALIPDLSIKIIDKALKEKQINVTSGPILDHEGSLWTLLGKVNNNPWCEMFVREADTMTHLVWRYNRWKDFQGKKIIDEADKEKTHDRDIPLTRAEGARLISDSSGITDANNFNGFLGMLKDANSVTATIQYIQATNNMNFLQDGSISFFGYRPIERRSSFLHPGKEQKFIVQYTDWLKKSFQDNLIMENGEWVFLGLLDIGMDCASISIEAEDYGSAGYSKKRFQVYPGQISWYWKGNDQQTVIQWERGIIV